MIQQWTKNQKQQIAERQGGEGSVVILEMIFWTPASGEEACMTVSPLLVVAANEVTFLLLAGEDEGSSSQPSSTFGPSETPSLGFIALKFNLVIRFILRILCKEKMCGIW